MQKDNHLTNENIQILLSKSPLLEGLSLEAVEKFSKIGILKSYKKQEIIFKQNDRSSDLFIVIEGNIEILFETEDQDIVERSMINPKFVTILSPGDSFGELALLTQENRTATVCSTEAHTTLFVCSRANFMDYCTNNPSDGLKIILNTSKKLSLIITQSNKIISDHYFTAHVAHFFKKFLVDIDLEKNLINPRESESIIDEASNFLISGLSPFNAKRIFKEYVRFTLFAENDVLKNLISDDEPHLGKIISSLLNMIRTHTLPEDPLISAKLSDLKEYRKGSMIIHKQGESNTIYLDWTIKDAEFDENLGIVRGNIHIFVYENTLPPNQAIERNLLYTKMAIQEKVVQTLQLKKKPRGTGVIVLHHRTSEVVNTLMNLRELGYTINAFIGVPYGSIDKRLTRILDYASDNKYFTLQTVNYVNKNSEFIFDFNSSSNLSMQNENKIRESFQKLSDKSYINSMLLLVSIVLEKVINESLSSEEPFIILEDGGYIFPFIYESYYQPNHPLHALIKKAIDKKLILGVVEGTASGEVRDFNCLSQFNDEQKKLIPLLSGARDSIKTDYESKGVSSTILQSSEVAMRNLGIRSFEWRKIVVIGGNGAVGTRLIEQLVIFQNTTANIGNVDKTETLFEFQIPDKYQNIYQHTYYNPIKRFIITHDDIVLTELMENIVEPLPNNGRFVITHSYENNEDVLLKKIHQLGYTISQSVRNPIFLDLVLIKNQKQYHCCFLSTTTVISYNSIKQALLAGVDTVLGATGASVFNESNLDTFFFRKSNNGKLDELVLISGSSKDVEFKKGLHLLNELMIPANLITDDRISASLNYFKELHAQKLQLFSDEYFDSFFDKNDVSTNDLLTLRSLYVQLKDKLNQEIQITKEIFCDVGSTFYLDIRGVKKSLILLADGLVINFFASYSKGVSVDYIDLILTLQLLGVNHLANRNTPGGFYRISDQLKPADLEILWSSLNDHL